MGQKKMGRPTDNPKTISLKVALDKGTDEKLRICAQKMEISKAEIVRRGIHKVYDSLEEK